MEDSFEWKIENTQSWEKFNDAEYINECCEYCDLVLYKIKDDICRNLEIGNEKILIGQEDWGWYLEAGKDNKIFVLNISYQGNENSEHIFSVNFEIKQQKSYFFFKLKTNAETFEIDKFSQKVNKIAWENSIKVY